MKPQIIFRSDLTDNIILTSPAIAYCKITDFGVRWQPVVQRQLALLPEDFNYHQRLVYTPDHNATSTRVCSFYLDFMRWTDYRDVVMATLKELLEGQS